MKFLILRRSVLSVFACAMAACAIFYVVSYPAVVGANATTRQLPIYCVQRDYKVLSISFDAAWGSTRMRHQ